MITKTIASNRINSDNDSGGNNKRGWGVFTIMLRTTITIKIVLFDFLLRTVG